MFNLVILVDSHGIDAGMLVNRLFAMFKFVNCSCPQFKLENDKSFSVISKLSIQMGRYFMSSFLYNMKKKRLNFSDIWTKWQQSYNNFCLLTFTDDSLSLNDFVRCLSIGFSGCWSCEKTQIFSIEYLLPTMSTIYIQREISQQIECHVKIP